MNSNEFDEINPLVQHWAGIWELEVHPPLI